MTKLQKLYRGLYEFPAPDSNTSRWTDDDWIRFIDSRGRWIDVQTEKIEHIDWEIWKAGDRWQARTWWCVAKPSADTREELVAEVARITREGHKITSAHCDQYGAE